MSCAGTLRAAMYQRCAADFEVWRLALGSASCCAGHVGKSDSQFLCTAVLASHTWCVLLLCCRAYVSGRLQPGPFHLVAPFFKFPPVAMPPPLEAIPESVTPTASSASRASSSQDLSMGSMDPGRSSPGLDADDIALLQVDSMSDVSSSISSSGSIALQQPSLDTLGSPPVAGWAWIAPPSGDAEEGGTARSS